MSILSKSLSRRSFFRLGGAAAVAVASAPLFIPSSRLEYGVPKLMTAMAMPSHVPLPKPGQIQVLYGSPAPMKGTVPVLMVQDQYYQQYGGKLRAGSRVLVDKDTAIRWQRIGIALREWA